MSARIFTFEHHWRAAMLRRELQGSTDTIPEVSGDMVPLPQRRSRGDFVTIFELRNDRGWLVVGLDERYTATFRHLAHAMTFGLSIAQPVGAGVEVYRRDCELSA